MKQKAIRIDKEALLEGKSAASGDDINELEDILNFLAPRLLDVKQKIADGQLELQPEFEVERGELDQICRGLGITTYIKAWISSESVHTKE